MTRPLLNIPVDPFDPKAAEHICKELSQGIVLAQTLRDWPEELGVAPSRWTVYDWRKKSPEFDEAYLEAREMGCDALAEDIPSIIEDGSKDWITRKDRNGNEYEVVDQEALGRSKLRVYGREKVLAMWSHRYRPQQGIQLSNPEGGPVEFTDAAASAKIASLLSLAAARKAGTDEPDDGSDLA